MDSYYDKTVAYIYISNHFYSTFDTTAGSITQPRIVPSLSEKWGGEGILMVSYGIQLVLSPTVGLNCVFE